MKIPNIITRNINKTSAFWLASSVTLILLSHFSVIPSTMIEVVGFLTGALCVYLLVKQNIWNWPIGIINAVMYIVLFYQARLFADMGLQVVYVVLGMLGWYWWYWY
jgi:nicotinamide mononucleotide transporter